MKYCSKCGIEKPFEDFGKHRLHKDGLRGVCKECEAKMKKKRSEFTDRDRNRERKWEKKQRDSLTDLMIKKQILIASRGTVKTAQITPEMIKEKRESIIKYRANQKNIIRRPKGPFKYVCMICNKTFISRQRKHHVCQSEMCIKESEKRRALKYNTSKKIKEKKCKECGKSFVSEYGDKRNSFCNNKCLRKYYRRIRRAKERARLKKVKVEQVNPIEVFMRDGWICQLCGERLKSKDRGKFINKAPELDHIIPLSKGGDHSYLNTQCVCRKCNIEKNNNDIGQLRLFG